MLCLRFSLNYVPKYRFKQISKILSPEFISIKVRLVCKIFSKQFSKLIKSFLFNAAPYIKKYFIQYRPDIWY